MKIGDVLHDTSVYERKTGTSTDDCANTAQETQEKDNENELNKNGEEDGE